MAYAARDKILVSDINGFINNNIPSVNGLWGSGSGSTGYGQTPISGATERAVISSPVWSTLINTITAMGNHQGTSIASLTLPSSRSLVQYYNQLASNINAINSGRLNAALQGSTTPYTLTNAVSWSDYLRYQCTVTFTDHNSARYFFNSGGQIGISASHPNTSGINRLISAIATALGTVWLSSTVGDAVTLAGTQYNGVTKVGGGSPTSTVINTNWGFYAWVNSLTQVIQQKTNTFNYSEYTANTNISVSVAYNGSGVVTITVDIDEIPNGATVSGGTELGVTIRMPSNKYISNTWGAVTASITRTVA